MDMDDSDPDRSYDGLDGASGASGGAEAVVGGEVSRFLVSSWDASFSRSAFRGLTNSSTRFRKVLTNSPSWR